MQDLGHSFHSPKYELTNSHGDPVHGSGFVRYFMSWDEIDDALGIGDTDLGLEGAVADASELGAFMQEEVAGDVAEQIVKQGLIDTVAGTVGSSMVAMSPYVALAGSLAETAGVAGVMISSGIMIHQLISTAIENVGSEALSRIVF